jgi:hypothetical protein
MESNASDTVRSTMVDGNAAAGILSEVFALEVTGGFAKCANCGREGEMGSLLAFMQAPGVVLRCPVCEHVNLRVVQAPESIYLDLKRVIGV